MKLLAPQKLPLRINPNSAFYILNPAGDLESTENTFKSMFSRLSWKGLTRVLPEESVIERVIQENDLYVYCGHGSGCEYYDYHSLVENKRPCRASMLLMGCSSGELLDDGERDPTGVVNDCVAAGAGAVVANLWNVTDRDIDRFLANLVNETAIKGGGRVLEEAVQTSRKACRLKFLTGAAPVVYGFPTVVVPDSSTDRARRI
jgi:separase